MPAWKFRKSWSKAASETDRAAVMAAIQVKRGDPIMKFDPEAARAGLERLPWVATATVERRLPNTVFVKLDERRPMALWQRDGKLALIDRDGEVLTERGLGPLHQPAPDHRRRCAEARAGTARPAGTEPALYKRVNAAARIGGRRWDLHLTNGVVIRLPESDIGGALHPSPIRRRNSRSWTGISSPSICGCRTAW